MEGFSNRNLILILMLALFFFSMQGVFAGDLNDSDDSHSFADLQNLIDSGDGQIDLEDDYTYHENDTAVTISKPVVINGNNHTIDALNKSRIFTIESDNVSITNINFINANCGDSDLWMGVTCITFRDVIVSDSESFSDYYHDNPIPCDAFGGAILSKGDNFKISGCVFNTNHASLGGAIYIWGENSVIDNVTFLNNTAYEGAAVFSNGRNTTVSNSRFVRNAASFLGSAIYQRASGIRIIDSTFAENAACGNATVSFREDDWEFSGVNSSYYYSLIDFTRIYAVDVSVENHFNGTYDLTVRFLKPYGYGYHLGEFYENAEGKSFLVDIEGKTYVLKVVNGTAGVTFTSLSRNCDIRLYNPVTQTDYNTTIVLYDGPVFICDATDGLMEFIDLFKEIDSNDCIIMYDSDTGHYVIKKLKLDKSVASDAAKENHEVPVKGPALSGGIEIRARENSIVKSQAKIRITLKGKIEKRIVNVRFNGRTYKISVDGKGVGYFKLPKSVLKSLKKGKKYSYVITYGNYNLKRYITVK